MVGLYNSSIDPLMGILPGLKAFVAAVVGGIGSIPGAALGGLIMGVSESLLKGYISPQWSGLADALAFAILIVVLLFRPSGLLGQTVREKV
jgi:branched-chain amino acid transport system permease protein